MAEGARLHPDDRSRALAHPCAAATEDGFRLRVDGRAARAQSDQRDAGRRRRVQHRRGIPRGPSVRDAAAAAGGSRGGPPAPRGAARPSGHDRARRARSGEQAVEPPQAGEPAAGRRDRASGRHADAGGECDVESSRLGQLRRPECQPRGRDVSHRIRRLRAGAGRAAADRLRHHHRLPERRAEQTLRRSQHRRCAD